MYSCTLGGRVPFSAFRLSLCLWVFSPSIWLPTGLSSSLPPLGFLSFSGPRGRFPSYPSPSTFSNCFFPAWVRPCVMTRPRHRGPSLSCPFWFRPRWFRPCFLVFTLFFLFLCLVLLPRLCLRSLCYQPGGCLSSSGGSSLGPVLPCPCGFRGLLFSRLFACPSVSRGAVFGLGSSCVVPSCHIGVFGAGLQSPLSCGLVISPSFSGLSDFDLPSLGIVSLGSRLGVVLFQFPGDFVVSSFDSAVLIPVWLVLFVGGSRVLPPFWACCCSPPFSRPPRRHGPAAHGCLRLLAFQPGLVVRLRLSLDSLPLSSLVVLFPWSVSVACLSPLGSWSWLACVSYLLPFGC